MKKITITAQVYLLFFVLLALHAGGQERLAPLHYNPQVKRVATAKTTYAKTTAALLQLPFFEDFTGYDPLPDSNKWTDQQVYINNTMCVSPISRGVATFDVLDASGYPWDPYGTEGYRYCDSLTSRAINLDLGTVTPGDSVYLSFFYQAQGNGFIPLIPDSLMLMFRTRYGGWLPVWKIPGGTAAQAFRQVMIPIADSLYFSDSFQFRFINIGALNLSDANWNLDYIRLDKNRNFTDTGITDIAFTANPTSLLNDYYSMPYRQFLANTTGETALSYSDSIYNADFTVQPVTAHFSARALNTGTSLYVSPAVPANLNATATQSLTYGNYSTTIPLPGTYDKVVFENKYYIDATAASGPLNNDTIVHDQVFDNYLAYDDGTAEQAYYLNLYPTQPGEIAIEHHLNAPDTMRGMAIYFGRQVPDAYNEVFNIVVYSALAGVNGAFADDTLLTQQLCVPGFADTINHFYIYKFDRPLALNAGTFYAGTVQPADFGSDSLYFGFDINRRGGNHTYYNVLGSWNPSLFQGAIMMRPLLGQNVVSSHVDAVKPDTPGWAVNPNPATDKLTFTFTGDAQAHYQIQNIQGQLVATGSAATGSTIDISALQAGMYFVSISVDGVASTPVKIVKL